MYRHLSVAVVIPAFNEERAIANAIDVVPDFVDHIVVVDDASVDDTAKRAERRSNGRRSFEIVRHGANRGVGGAIISGYRRVVDAGIDVAVVMAGDGQMDPADLPALVDPIAEGNADYCKGNRFQHGDVWREMPKARLLGNVMLSAVTKITSGYWRVFDSQCGYTAITVELLRQLDLDRVFPRYGYPNDLLARLHCAGARVVDVPVRPIYGRDWKSGINLGTVIYPVAYVLLRSMARRLLSEVFGRGSRALPESTEV